MKTAVSPCPNDIYIFSGWLQGDSRLPASLKPSFTFLDIEELNQAALRQEYDLIKVSAAVAGELTENYEILSCGGAMGYGCGPLLLLRRGEELKGSSRIGIPGWKTTALRLFSLFYPHQNLVQIRFDLLEQALLEGSIDAALIIHETRFSFNRELLVASADLGKLWEEKYQCPIPLGLMLLHRRMSVHRLAVEEAIRSSIRHAQANEASVIRLCQSHADSMDLKVLKQHIDLYVNDFSIEIGPEGIKALQTLGIA
jgi:1,4-dihydroxy-6-naphthoate synthase